MKKIGLLMIMALLLVGVVSATTTTLSDPSLSMAYEDVREVEFCLSEAGGQQNIAVVVDPVCKDVDGNYGCQVGDADATGLFSAVPNQLTMNDGECIMLTLTTTILDEEDAGNFYYTVNGNVGETTIGSETGKVLVPEFGVVAALGILGAAGFLISRKRK